MEDGAIVDLYLCRDEAAVAATAEKYGPRLRGLAQTIVDDPPTAEECENDTYLWAWNAIPPHEPRDYLFPFLARVVRHVALDRCRARSRLKRSALLCELTEEMEECIPAPDDLECRLDDMVLREALNRFLGTLGERERNVFLRRYWFMDPVADIARRYGISRGSVKTMLYRSRKRLRTFLEQEGYVL